MALQGVNAAATLGNFAPLRLGMLERIAYHLRVDRMRAMQIAAWFTVMLASVLGPTAAAGIALVAGVTSLGPLILVMVIGSAVFTLIGQALEDVLNPRLRGGRAQNVAAAGGGGT